MDPITQLLWTRTTRWTPDCNLSILNLILFHICRLSAGALVGTEGLDILRLQMSWSEDVCLSFSTEFLFGFVILMILKGATADQVSGWKEPWREGSHLRLCIQSWNLRDSGDGEHVGHLHDQQRGEHVPQANPRPLRLECSQHCLQHQGKIYCNIVDISLA